MVAGVLDELVEGGWMAAGVKKDGKWTEAVVQKGQSEAWGDENEKARGEKVALCGGGVWESRRGWG